MGIQSYLYVAKVIVSKKVSIKVIFCVVSVFKNFYFYEQQAEEAAQAREEKKVAHDTRVAERAERAAAAAANEANRSNSIAKSPSEHSCHSYELFIGQEKGVVDDNKEKMSIRSDTLSQGKQSLYSNKIHKVSAVSICCSYYIMLYYFLV